MRWRKNHPHSEGRSLAHVAEALGIEGAAELDVSAFSSDGLTVSLVRTANGKAKASVTPQGQSASLFLRVKVK